MEMAAAKAGYDLARAEEEVADKAFVEAETLLKRRRRAEHTAKMQVTDIMRRRLEDAKQRDAAAVAAGALAPAAQQAPAGHPPPAD